MSLQMELCKELFVAAKGGDEEGVKRTIDEGVDVDYQNEVIYPNLPCMCMLA